MNRDKAVDVALAEFNALRSEIVSHTTTQAALVGLGLTALGVIVGFTAKEGGSERPLLAIPALTLLVVLLHTAGTYRITLIGNYIKNELWPYLARTIGDTDLPSWESSDANRRQGWTAIPRALFVDFPAMALFILAGVIALVHIGNEGVLWFFGWLMVIAAIVVPLLFGLKIRKNSRAGPT